MEFSSLYTYLYFDEPERHAPAVEDTDMVRNRSIQRSTPCRLALAVATAFSSTAAMAEEIQLDVVQVRAKRGGDAHLAQPANDSSATVYRVDRALMSVFDSPGGSNPYTAVAEIPGVKITTVDPYGLNNAQGGQKGMRVRGEVSTHGVSGTVEGLSLGGPGPGPGYLFLFDKENIEQIEFAQGPIAADRGGLFNTYGALDTRLRWPDARAGAEATVRSGSFGFLRTFARVDTGLLPSGTAIFASASRTTADKWRGEGSAPGNRDNIELGLTQQLGRLSVGLFFARNDQAQHNYKALTYAQASDLGRYRKYDYGTSSASSDYFDYNRQDFLNQVLLADIRYALDSDTVFSLKPYYAKEQGRYLYAGGSASQVLGWLLDHETYGLTAEIKSRFATTDLKLGYAWTSTAPPGPPTTRKQYQVVGGRLVFQQWALLSEVVDRHAFQNLYLTAAQDLGKLKLNGSVRYMKETLPGIDAYKAGTATSGASWDVSPDTAIARAVKDPIRSVSSRSIDQWLPQLGASYALTPTVELRANAGQTFGAPAFDAFNQPLAGGITRSQQYWDALRPELATGIDLGARVRLGDAYLDPVLYYSRSRNKSVSVFSSTTNTVYGQNVGRTEASGFQLAAGWNATSALQLVSALSYSRSVFREDVRTTGGEILPVEGRQLPDVPKWMGNAGVVWRHQGFTVAPMLQYVGPRWASSTYDQRVSGYWLADLSMGYETRTTWGKWMVSAAVMNLFDRNYIGQISTSEVNTTANGAIYYPGAPRTFVASVGVGF